MQPKHSLAAGAIAVAAALTAGLITVSARATAQDGFSSGEASDFLLCFFECKRNFDINVDDDDDDDDDDNANPRPGDGYWKEVTLLVLANQRNESVDGGFELYDGNRGFLYNATVLDGAIYEQAFNLSQQDLAEINICRRLDRELRPQPVPEAGLIAIYPSNPGVYGWVKNVLGEINRFIEDPFNSPVRDVAKTECRVVPEIFQ
jgi:hypothetical protein